MEEVCRWSVAVSQMSIIVICYILVSVKIWDVECSSVVLNELAAQRGFVVLKHIDSFS